MPSVHPLEFLNMVDNIDPSLRPEMEKVFTPQGSSPVASSPNFVFIVSNYLRGLTPLEINKLLENEKKEYIAPNVIRDYMLQYVPAYLMRQNLIHKYLVAQPGMDEIQIMESTLKMQMARVANRVDKPTVDTDDEESTRRDIDLLHKMAYNTLEAKIKTGRVAQVPQQHEHHVTQKSEIKHTHEVLDTRTASQAWKLMEKIRLMDTKLEGDGEDTN
jgi:hypothetical protein